MALMMPCGHPLLEARNLGVDDDGNRKYICCGRTLVIFLDAEKMQDQILRDKAETQGSE